MRFVMVIAVLAGAYAARADEWRPVETGLEATYVALQLVDMSQTLDAVRHRDDPSRPPSLWHGETNPVQRIAFNRLGVYTYTAGVLAGHALVSYLLPRPYRSVWQSFTVGLEAGVVGWNYSAGLNLSF